MDKPHVGALILECGLWLGHKSFNAAWSKDKSPMRSFLADQFSNVAAGHGINPQFWPWVNDKSCTVPLGRGIPGDKSSDVLLVGG